MKFNKFLAIVVVLLLSTVGSFGQTATNFNNCSELDGYSISIFLPAPATQIDTFTVTDLQDSDLIEVSIAARGTNGLVNVQMEASSSTFLTTSVRPGDSDSGSFDPDGDQASIGFTITSEFVDEGPGLEMDVDYIFNCTPGAGTSSTSDSMSPTAPVVTAFLGERNRRILDERPDRPRMVRKRLDSLWGDASGQQPNEFDSARITNFWASPNRVRAHIGLRDFSKVLPADIPVLDPEIPMPPEAPKYGCWDAWAEAHYTRFFDSGDRDGNFAIGYLGVDCQIRPAIMVGFLGQIDWMEDEIGSVDAQTEGVGWMVGPYMTARLTPDLYLDLRAAWGQSDNDVNVAGVTGSFDTTRWLVDGQLTGNFQLGDVRITPEVSLTYIEDRQSAYTDSIGVGVPAQTVSLARLRFGPEISRRYALDSGIFVEPHLSIRGLWDFAANDVTIAGIDYNIEGLRGVAEIGVIIQRPDDFNIRVSAKYDGIGLNDYHAYGGQIWINIPLK